MSTSQFITSEIFFQNLNIIDDFLLPDNFKNVIDKSELTSHDIDHAVSGPDALYVMLRVISKNMARNTYNTYRSTSDLIGFVNEVQPIPRQLKRIEEIENDLRELKSKIFSDARGFTSQHQPQPVGIPPCRNDWAQMQGMFHEPNMSFSENQNMIKQTPLPLQNGLGGESMSSHQPTVKLYACMNNFAQAYITAKNKIDLNFYSISVKVIDILKEMGVMSNNQLRIMANNLKTIEKLTQFEFNPEETYSITPRGICVIKTETKG